MSLADKTCIPCSGGTAKLTDQEIKTLSAELSGWTVQDEKLLKSIKTKDFAKALEAANSIGALAEEQGHHPDLLVRWGELKIELSTHAIGGLSEADFILAAKIDKLPLA